MFDDLFSTQSKQSVAIDTYLDRMERILRIKKLADETGELKTNEQMSEFITEIAKATVKILNESVEEENEDVK